MTLLEVSGLCSGYGPKRVLEDVDVVVHPGEVVALLGPNGAGKTTFLASLVNATRRFSGAIRFENPDVTAPPTWRFASQGVAVVPRASASSPASPSARTCGLDATRRGAITRTRPRMSSFRCSSSCARSGVRGRPT